MLIRPDTSACHRTRIRRKFAAVDVEAILVLCEDYSEVGFSFLQRLYVDRPIKWWSVMDRMAAVLAYRERFGGPLFGPELDGQTLEIVALDGMPLAYRDPNHPTRVTDHLLDAGGKPRQLRKSLP